jgi:hypothetical protein
VGTPRRRKASRLTPRQDLWTLDEYVVVADLWLRRGRSSGVHDREVLDLARLTGRTAASISRRLGNFEGTAHEGRGLKPVTGEPAAVFRAMQADSDLRVRLVAESRARLTAVVAAAPTLSQVVRAPRLVDPEESRVERIEVRTEATVWEMVRAEAELVRRYRSWLDPAGTRLRGIVIPVGDENLRVDLYDTALDLLIEAKGQVTRELIRHAIGQLIDYRRYLSPRPRLAILPSEAAVDMIWADSTGFTDSAGGQLVRRAPPEEGGPPSPDAP